MRESISIIRSLLFVFLNPSIFSLTALHAIFPLLIRSCIASFRSFFAGIMRPGILALFVHFILQYGPGSVWVKCCLFALSRVNMHTFSSL